MFGGQTDDGRMELFWVLKTVVIDFLYKFYIKFQFS